MNEVFIKIPTVDLAAKLKYMSIFDLARNIFQ